MESSHSAPATSVVAAEMLQHSYALNNPVEAQLGINGVPSLPLDTRPRRHEENEVEDDDEEECEEDEADDNKEGQMAIAAHAAAQALTENDHSPSVTEHQEAEVGASVYYDDVDMGTLENAGEQQGSREHESTAVCLDLYVSQRKQTPQHLLHSAISDNPAFDEPMVQATSVGAINNDSLTDSPNDVEAVNHDSHRLSLQETDSFDSQLQGGPLITEINIGSRPGSPNAQGDLKHSDFQLAALTAPVPETIEHPFCCICGQGNEVGRQILRFLPVTHDFAAAQAAPGVMTFGQDILLHIFCGKTASILPTVNRPDLEILTKAGLKNKHGIGPEVNAALARTRTAVFLPVEPIPGGGRNQKNDKAEDAASANNACNKEKQFYLVREFEAHLASIRHTHISFDADPGQGSLADDPFVAPANLASLEDVYVDEVGDVLGIEYALPPEINITSKVPPIKANAGQLQKSRRYNTASATSVLEQQHDAVIPYGVEIQSDGKIKCPCGGTHLPLTQQRGAQSWRNHIMTKRHQKWMEEHGLMGAV